MNKRRFLATATTTDAAAFLLASSAHATSLTPGGSVSPGVFGFNLGTETQIANTGVLSYSTNVSGNIEAGTYQARVFRSGAFLDFVYDFNENNTSNVALQSATMANFAGFTTD